MALDGKSISPMDHVALGTKLHYVALGTVSVDHISPLDHPYTPRTPQKYKNT